MKNTEYDIFVKSLKNRIDKAKNSKYLSLNSNSTEEDDGTNSSIPVDVDQINHCKDVSTSPHENLKFIRSDLQVRIIFLYIRYIHICDLCISGVYL